MNEQQEQEQQEEQPNKIIRNVLKCYIIVGNSRSIIFINKCSSSNEKQFFMKIKNFQSFNLNIKIEDTCSGCCC